MKAIKYKYILFQSVGEKKEIRRWRKNRKEIYTEKMYKLATVFYSVDNVFVDKSILDARTNFKFAVHDIVLLVGGWFKQKNYMKRIRYD